jgi:hypothetical protein
MEAALVVDVLPAERGDCLWIECQRRDGRPWRMLVDGGMPTSWPALQRRIGGMPVAERSFDLAIVSHIDSDHIGGMLPLLQSADLGVTFGDIWFNGLPQLPLPADQRPRSAAEGESLVKLLSSAEDGPSPPWNQAFGRAAVMTSGDGAFKTVEFRDGPTLTLLSPTPKRLLALRKTWVRELGVLQRGEASEPPVEAPPLAALEDLRTTADTKTTPDASATNGSSIAVLLEYAGLRCLLAADAFSTVLGAALTSLANARDGQPIQLDLFKLPHHGSKGNVTAKLLALVPARHYVISSNGDRFHHPDDIALARVATVGDWERTLWFNYRNEMNLRWSDERLRRAYGFTTEYPADGEDSGVRITLQGRPA